MAVVLVVAGLDPSGGAGLLADVATVRARMHQPIAVATALTEQDWRGCVRANPVEPEIVGRQVRRLLEGGARPAAVKIGMLGRVATGRAVLDALAPLGT